MAPCASASLIATVREDGLSLFRAVSVLIPGSWPQELFGNLVDYVDQLGYSHRMNDRVNNELVEGDVLTVSRRLLDFDTYRLSGEHPGRAGAVLLSHSLGKPILVLLLNEAGRVSDRSFLVNQQGVFPIHSLQGSGFPVPAVQLLEVGGVWYPITTGRDGRVYRRRSVDRYLTDLIPRIDELLDEAWSQSGNQLVQGQATVLDWFRRLRRLLATISDGERGDGGNYIVQFRSAMAVMQRFYSISGFSALMQGLEVDEQVRFIGQLLEYGDVFGFIMDLSARGRQVQGGSSSLTLNQLFLRFLRTTQSLAITHHSQGGFPGDGERLPIRFSQERVFIEFNPSSYVHQLLLILHIRCQMLEFNRMAIVTYSLGLSDDQKTKAQEQQSILISHLHTMIQALVKKHYGAYWGETYYRPIIIRDGSVVLFRSDPYAPRSGWKGGSSSGQGEN
ncbi:hypothetical protein [Endozoicomonas lisbonensis]|uniref:hypothetical protein n=1 Tax=Endozoicomonas lisbonensis TaxID=3120522 RepID=UPI00339A249E